MEYKQIVGKFGEKIAGDYLVRRGYRIIEKNAKISYQELDIVARHNGALIFAEVKTRTSSALGEADEAMSRKKIKSLKEAIQKYIILNKISDQDIRLDFISVDIDKKRKTAKIRHYKDIF